jgi:hypothetical protein
MEAMVQLPEVLAHRLEMLAQEEGTSVDGLVRRMVSEHLERRKAPAPRVCAPRGEVRFPLIPKEDTGVISPVSGADIDEMFACEDLAS